MHLYNLFGSLVGTSEGMSNYQNKITSHCAIAEERFVIKIVKNI